MTTQLCKYYVGCLLLIRKFSQWKIPIVLFSTDRKINSKRMIAFSSIAFVVGKFSLHQSPFFLNCTQIKNICTVTDGNETYVLHLLAIIHTCYATCRDQIPDCAEYTKTACQAPYDTWARTNCPLFCGFCCKVWFQFFFSYPRMDKTRVHV